MHDKVFVIAEAGVNHNGCLQTAKHLVEVAADAGADAVKFQTFKADQLTTKAVNKAPYQVAAKIKGKTQYEMLRALELSHSDFVELKQYCDELDIEFMSTPFDVESLNFLVNNLAVKRLKISSGELTNGPLVLQAAASRLPLILSTGMSTLTEIQEVLALIAWEMMHPGEVPMSQEDFLVFNQVESWREKLKNRVTLLHCVSQYPAPLDTLNISFINELAHKTKLPVGFSDHSVGTLASICACARGAKVIEKHFTLSKFLPGPDHKASLEPEALKSLVQQIRETEVILGEAKKTLSKKEEEMRRYARGSLVALKEINQGEKFTRENIGIKRAGKGISPLNYWDYISKHSLRHYVKDELIMEV